MKLRLKIARLKLQQLNAKLVMMVSIYSIFYVTQKLIIALFILEPYVKLAMTVISNLLINHVNKWPQIV